MTRFVLVTVVLLLLARVLWHLVRGILQGLSASPHGARVLRRGGQMVRDPVCGMFILPAGAVTIGSRDQLVHFCSTDCRDKYQRQTA